MSTSGLRLNEHKDGDLLRGKTPIENLLGRFRFKRQIYFPGLAKCLFLAAGRNFSLNLAVFDFKIAHLDRTGRAERFFLVCCVRHIATHNFSVGIRRNDERTPVTAEGRFNVGAYLSNDLTR
jgi:hypothetical protein